MTRSSTPLQTHYASKSCLHIYTYHFDTCYPSLYATTLSSCHVFLSDQSIYNIGRQLQLAKERRRPGGFEDRGVEMVAFRDTLATTTTATVAAIIRPPDPHTNSSSTTTTTNTTTISSTTANASSCSCRYAYGACTRCVQRACHIWWMGWRMIRGMGFQLVCVCSAWWMQREVKGQQE